MAKNETYEEFTEKFKPKKTTDDCYTPAAVYEAVRDYALTLFPDWQGRPVVRPFYPGGDFERFDYPEGCVVIDNPPFSIYSKIVRWFCDRGIDFFLFAPGLTTFTPKREELLFLITNVSITYKNGAVVNTNFVTNHQSDFRVMVDPVLREKVLEIQKKDKKRGKKIAWSPHIVSSALLGKFASGGAAIAIRKTECVRFFEKPQPFSECFIVSTAAAERLAAAERQMIAERQISEQAFLSEKSHEIIKELDKINENYSKE